MPSASTRRCTTHYRPSTTWSPEEDQRLLDARKSGMNWGPIAEIHFKSKTANACRKRHERLQERLNSEAWDGPKLEMLATAYQEVRQEMWSILGARVGERWSTVEAKCMDKGLKTLNVAARARRRRNSSDDSGIGLDEPDYRPDYRLEYRPELHVPRHRHYIEEYSPYDHGHRLPPPRATSSGPSVQSLLSPPQDFSPRYPPPNYMSPRR